MSSQDALFDEPTPTPVEDVVEEVESQRSTFSLAKREFLLGLFATWIARDAGREKANAADRTRARPIAEKALAELYTDPERGGRQ